MSQLVAWACYMMKRVNVPAPMFDRGLGSLRAFFAGLCFLDWRAAGASVSLVRVRFLWRDEVGVAPGASALAAGDDWPGTACAGSWRGGLELLAELLLS